MPLHSSVQVGQVESSSSLVEKWPYGSPFFCLWARLVGSPSSSVQVGLDRSPYLLVRLWMTLAMVVDSRLFFLVDRRLGSPSSHLRFQLHRLPSVRAGLNRSPSSLVQVGPGSLPSSLVRDRQLGSSLFCLRVRVQRPLRTLAHAGLNRSLSSSARLWMMVTQHMCTGAAR